MIDSGAFPASPVTPGQARSRTVWAALQASESKPAWWQDYLAIREAFPHFKNWRIWVYIAWAGQPAGERSPKTLEEFAPLVLGCSSRVVRGWRAKSWGEDLASVDEAIAWVQAAPLLRHRRDIYEALVSVAKTHDAKAHNDRKLALELLGDYRPSGSAPAEKEKEQMNGWLKDLREAA